MRKRSLVCGAGRGKYAALPNKAKLCTIAHVTNHQKLTYCPHCKGLVCQMKMTHLWRMAYLLSKSRKNGSFIKVGQLKHHVFLCSFRGGGGSLNSEWSQRRHFSDQFQRINLICLGCIAIGILKLIYLAIKRFKDTKWDKSAKTHFVSKLRV